MIIGRARRKAKELVIEAYGDNPAEQEENLLKIAVNIKIEKLPADKIQYLIEKDK